MRLLCDHMLERLARWLRAAGHDAAATPPGCGNAEIVELARREGRRLLTKNRALAGAAGEDGVLIQGDGAEAEAASLTRQLAIDWRLSPFTRCVMDNTPLREASEAEIARMPVGARALGGPFNACPACGRLFWPGSHVKRMAARLEHLSRATNPGA